MLLSMEVYGRPGAGIGGDGATLYVSLSSEVIHPGRKGPVAECVLLEYHWKCMVSVTSSDRRRPIQKDLGLASVATANKLPLAIRPPVTQG